MSRPFFPAGEEGRLHRLFFAGLLTSVVATLIGIWLVTWERRARVIAESAVQSAAQCETNLIAAKAAYNDLRGLYEFTRAEKQTCNQ